MSISTQTTQTMLSTEIVKIINDMREEGAAVLQHNNFMAKVVKVLGEGGALNFQRTYIDSQNKERPCYALPKREANLMVMSESYKVQAAVYDKMVELEAVTLTSTKEKVEIDLLFAQMVFDTLRLPDSGKLAILGKIEKAHGITSFLPGYAVDAPTTSGSSLVTYAVSSLLKENGSTMSAPKFNIIAIERGFLCELTRTSKTKGTKTFKSLTEKGLKFGKNLTVPQNPRETSPHYYKETFLELLELLK